MQCGWSPSFDRTWNDPTTKRLKTLLVREILYGFHCPHTVEAANTVSTLSSSPSLGYPYSPPLSCSDLLVPCRYALLTENSTNWPSPLFLCIISLKNCLPLIKWVPLCPNFLKGCLSLYSSPLPFWCRVLLSSPYWSLLMIANWAIYPPFPCLPLLWATCRECGTVGRPTSYSTW